MERGLSRGYLGGRGSSFGDVKAAPPGFRWRTWFHWLKASHPNHHRVVTLLPLQGELRLKRF